MEQFIFITKVAVEGTMVNYISIDGKTALLGDKVYYRVNIDASRLTDTAYKVWRLGMTDDYDQEYLTLDAKHVEILDETGRDRTGEFNIQDKDGVLYAFAKTVDTQIPATGETVPGDPQPDDLKAYSEKTDKDYDPLKEAIAKSYLFLSVSKIISFSARDTGSFSRIA